MTSPSLLALTRALATDDETKAAFRDDPEGFLDARGHGDLDPTELATALEHVADALPAPLAAALTTVGDAGSDLADLLAGVAGIDPDEADARWAQVSGSIDEDGDPLDGLDDRDEDADRPQGLGDDPADFDDEPGGFDRAGDPDDTQDDEELPGGLDPVGGTATEAIDDTTFGDGTGEGHHPDADPGSDGPGGFDLQDPDEAAVPGLDDRSGWAPDTDEPGGFDHAVDPADAGEEPGGLDRADDPD